MKTLLALLFLATTTHAQTLITAGPTIAGASNAGLDGPIAGIQTALRARHSRFELAARLSYLPHYPKSPDGRARSAETDLRIYAGRFFVAPGFSRTTAYFDQASRTSTHLSLGGGYSSRNATISGYYRLPDRTRYKLDSAGARLDLYRNLTERLIFVLTPGIEVFRCRFEGSQTGVKPSLGAGIGVRM